MSSTPSTLHTVTSAGPIRRIRQVGLALALVAGSVAAPRPIGSASGQAATPAGQPPSGVPLVRLPFPQDDGTLTPYTFQLGYSLMTLVYDTLLWRDAGGKPQPWLARSVATSPDGRSVTVKLAPAVHWQDGRALTSADVAFTYRYMAAHPHPRFTPEVAPIVSIATPDAVTVVFHLRSPEAGFADQPLADVPILPAHLWEGLSPGTVAPPGLPVGSGPYRLAEYHPGQGYRFVANTDYFRGTLLVQTLEVSIVSDRSTMLRLFTSGLLDALPEDLLPAEAATVRGVGVRLETGASYTGTVLMFNLRQPPFDRAAVRMGVAAALNLPELATASGGGPAADHGYLHPQSSWSSPVALQHYDPSKARMLLSGATPVTILAPNNEPDKVRAAQGVATSLTQAGVVAAVKTVDPTQLDAAVGEGGAAPTFQAAIWSSPALASNDPSILGRLFSGSAAFSLDYPGYQSSAFATQAQRIETATDPGVRATAVQLALGRLASDVPVVPLYFATGVEETRPAVYRDWVYVKGTGILDKQSFLLGTSRANSVTTTVPVTSTTLGAVASATNSGTGQGGGVVSLSHFIWLSAGAAVVLLAVLATLSLRDRRSPADR